MKPLTDAERILRQQQSPRIVELWRALQSLQTVLSFMNTGAHPDDETSSMLAAMSLRDGIDLSYACANRGEGGQNNIGTEVTHDLGVIRTAEMEQAAQLLNMKLYWLSQSEEDSVFDFGFSKSGKETLAAWGYEHSRKILVDIVRSERPDILCPTFLDLPGQHGHHRAMTQLVEEVFDLAADEQFTESSLPPWQPYKLYLPAWSGAGDAYDDDLPPPETTIIIDGDGTEFPSGWSWAQIAQHSRLCHATQGMGRWVAAGTPNQWPLHLRRSITGVEDSTLWSGIPATLTDIGLSLSRSELAKILQDAQAECDEAISLFPDSAAITIHAVKAVELIRQAINLLSQGANSESGNGQSTFLEVKHKLHQKERQLCLVVNLAAGVTCEATIAHSQLRPGVSVPYDIKLDISSQSPSSQADLKIKASASVVLPDGWEANAENLSLSSSITASTSYPLTYDPLSPAKPCVRVATTINNVETTRFQPFVNPPVVLPAISAIADPAKIVLNVQNIQAGFAVSFSDLVPATGKVTLDLPTGWSSQQTEDGQHVLPASDTAPGSYTIPVFVNDQPASSVSIFRHAHIQMRARCRLTAIDVLVIDATLAEGKVAYVGGGSDRVNHWLKAVGADVTDLNESDFSSTDLARFDTLVIGLFAFRTRSDLKAQIPEIHQWVANGGHLLTLYHRPWDDWDPDHTPPLLLEIGKPSIRWRVTDQHATVTHLLPDHALLNIPNKISDDDWEGWHKERGLYFAKHWHEDYCALLSMKDPDEQPLTGSLLSARIGRGRHTHTSLILHHQMENLVPGAFRLIANLIAPA